MRPTQWRRSTHAWIGVAVLLIVAGIVTVAAVLPSDGPPTSAQGVTPRPAAVTADPGVTPLLDSAPKPSPDRLAATLAPFVADPNLGALTGRVTDAVTGAQLWAQGADIPMQPASTNKVLTSAAALLTLDRDARMTTTVIAADQTASPGLVVLKGGGDPTLSAAPAGSATWYRDAARISDLADQVRKSGVVATAVKVDNSLYSGPTMAQGWDPLDILNGDIAPMESVMLDGGRTQPVSVDSWRSGTPALDAGRALAVALRVDPAAVSVLGPLAGGREIASVQSPPLVPRLQEMMSHSDNVMAESIAREVAGAVNQPESFDGAVRAVLGQIATAGVDTRGVVLFDSSGLSVDDRLTALTLDGVVNAAAGSDTPRLRPLVDLLPIAGGSGTLSNRYLDTDAGKAAAGFLRAKTGSLTGTNALAGIVTDAGGRALTFALISNNAGPTGRTAIDALAASLPVLRVHRMSTTPSVGATVDWDFAATVGAKLTRPAPPASDYTVRQAMAQLSEFARKAEGPVRDVTGLNEGAALTEARVIDRNEWVRAATESMRVMTGGTSDGSGKSAGFITSRVTGIQTGAVLAFISSGILGQYDPFATGGGELLLVYPNIIAVERQLRVDPADFRLWVCLHEVTHRVQFRANPWLADHMSQSLATITDDSSQDVAAMIGRLGEFVRQKRNTEGLPSEPNSEGVMGILRAMQSEPQRKALDQLLVLGTLLEGHAEHVMDAVGPAVVPSVATIRRRFDERRQTKQPPLQRLIRTLLGFDAKLSQYTRGKAFVDEVVGKVGMKRFNTVWSNAETLPLPTEVDKPQRWIDRVL